MRSAGILKGSASGARGLPLGAGGRRGQVLLIAVLLMTVVLLVGILFVALVSRNQEQSARHVDVVSAQALAEAGIRYADRMLQTSPLGADWRPSFVAYVPPSETDLHYPAYDPDDPSTWPNPPAMYENGDVDPNFYGPDGIEGTEDDYYSDFDLTRGWHPLRAGSLDAPGPFIRFGFHRYPAPTMDAQNGDVEDSPMFGKGYILLRLTYAPSPPFDPEQRNIQEGLSQCIRIEAIGRVSDQTTVFRRLVAYKPIGLTDHLRWITNKHNVVNRAYLGLRPYLDFDNSGTAEENEALEVRFSGPVRSDAPLYVLGQPIDDGGSMIPSTYFELLTSPSDDGYLRDDFIHASEGIFMMDGVADGAQVWVEGEDEGTLPTSLAAADSTEIPRVATGHRDVPPLEAPDIFASDPTTGLDRYRALTRDSGVIVQKGAEARVVNTGKFGHGQGVYVDNFADIQFKKADGSSDLRLLAQDWRQADQAGRLTGNSGWNALGTTYSPPAVEIELFASEADVLATSPRYDAGAPPTDFYSESAPTEPGVFWWPNHEPGQPGIKLTRRDARWRLGDPADAIAVGDDSGEYVMVIDYPDYPNQVIFCEGNIRVKGTLPVADREPTPPHALIRDFNLTIVSNATIYIDGQILSPQDIAGRRVDTNDADGVLDEDNTAVALLARDYVCLNPTQLVPQLTSGLVPAVSDDPMSAEAGSHWELDSDTGGQVYSRWRFGETVPDDVSVRLVTQQTAGSPGPSGVGLALAADGVVTGHDFGNPLDPYTFIFAPPGALLWGSISAPTSYCSTAIAPQWQPLANIGPFAGLTDPVVPWNISAGISKSVGVPNALALSNRDPRLGTPASEYWIKKWKIEEYDNALHRPRPAVNAKVNALIYAQRGSWFVIPGAYFNEKTYTVDFNGDGQIDGEDSLWAASMRRYNYRITVRGCITEDHTAAIEDVQDWSNKWAFPIYTSETELTWGTIEYEFDERLRVRRDQGLTVLDPGTAERTTDARLYSPQANLPRLPLLPVSPTLLYYGEAF